MKDMRPTTGKVLLALFNILGSLDGKRFLDLFSGSGQVAATALKHHADVVCAVESERKRHAAIVKKLPSEAVVLCMDVRRAVSRFSKKGEQFDIIFADPPYELGWGKELPALIAENAGILLDGGVFVFEHSEREKAADLEGFSREDRSYGGTILTFYRKGGADE
jgi:16S rRNA (guanine(966)-N(2))-methyltransferase RsmD